MPKLDRDTWRTLEPLLDQALDLDDEERARWLRELSAQSPDVAAELTLLLSGEVTADRSGFLSDRDQDRAKATLAGRLLGAYRLERPLGQGGMGTVWLASRSDGRFEGRAAVKILNLALLTATGQERFRREGSALARLTHPSIARLLDAGVGGSGEPYLVLEYVDGVPIDEHARARTLGPVERIRLVLQVLAAVGHAHSHLVVHRDLKPSNILVTADGVVKLLDFGIAKLLDGEEGGNRSDITLEGGRVFTPQYAAPEQIRGEMLTTATDVYALGVLLYVLLSGRHPTGAGVRPPAETVRALLEDEPARLRMGDLDTVLAKALRKAPVERYQTVGAFAEDIQRYLEGKPVGARPQSLAYRLERFIHRNRAAVAAGLLAAAGMVGATLFSLAQLREARVQRDAALRESRRADAQVEFQNLLLSEVGDRPTTMRQVLDAGRGLLERQSVADPHSRLTTLLQLAGSYADLGDTRVMGTLLARAESLALAGPELGRLPQIRCMQADHLRMQGRYKEAWRALAGADTLLASSGEHGGTLTCLAVRSRLAVETGRSAEAVVASRRALAIKDSLGQRRDLEYLNLLGALASSLHGVGRPRDAVVVFERAVAAMDSSGRGGMLSRSILRHDMALALGDLGESAEAERILHEVLERAARGDQSGRINWQPVVHYAEAALTQHHPDSAARYFTAIVRQAVGDTNLYWEGRGLFGLARAQVGLGRLADARRAKSRLEQIVAAYPHVKDTDDQVPDPRVLDGWLAMAEGQPAKARVAFMDVLRSYGFFEGRKRTRLWPVALLASECALAVGETEEALELARAVRAVADVDSLTGARSATVGSARLLEGRALLARGDSSEAHTALERARVALRRGGGGEYSGTREADALAAALER